LRDLLVYVENAGLKALMEQTLDRFDSRVMPVMNKLRSQVIHSDMHPGNVLVDRAQPDHISGLIDFGDLVKSPLIFDLAIACAYQLAAGEDPLQGALPMIAAYHAVRPLESLELDLLGDLIRTRLITSLLIGSYRVRLFPENRDYLMVSYESAKSFLTNMFKQDSDTETARIHSVCFPA
jgi:Ser/Thr protein kinase RdoA (MazF antagonist)